jgi:hypothetical protein
MKWSSNSMKTNREEFGAWWESQRFSLAKTDLFEKWRSRAPTTRPTPGRLPNWFRSFGINHDTLEQNLI